MGERIGHPSHGPGCLTIGSSGMQPIDDKSGSELEIQAPIGPSFDSVALEEPDEPSPPLTESRAFGAGKRGSSAAGRSRVSVGYHAVGLLIIRIIDIARSGVLSDGSSGVAQSSGDSIAASMPAFRTGLDEFVRCLLVKAKPTRSSVDGRSKRNERACPDTNSRQSSLERPGPVETPLERELLSLSHRISSRVRRGERR
jgi:hypothetical protein